MTTLHYGGPLHYLGNRFLSLPNISGQMHPDNSWLNEQFSVIQFNHREKYKRCIEPFAGCASWSIAAMEIGFAERYVINDSDKVLIGTLKLIKDDSERIKKHYSLLESSFEKASFKKSHFLKILDTYNCATDMQERALLLPFIINHSWSGILFHNSNGDILYREDPVGCQRFLEKANLSIEEFNIEVDRVSWLFNENDVEFKSGDFLNVLTDMQSTDFIALNPPYPENERSVVNKTGMYTELYSPEKLHKNLQQLIENMEVQGIHYYLTYGFYNPSLSQFVFRDALMQPKNYFRELGFENCAFGIGLDQMYFTSEFSIPEHLNTTIISAPKVLNGSMLQPQTALREYYGLLSK